MYRELDFRRAVFVTSIDEFQEQMEKRVIALYLAVIDNAEDIGKVASYLIVSGIRLFHTHV
jgi:hypothetical protein